MSGRPVRPKKWVLKIICLGTALQGDEDEHLRHFYRVYLRKARKYGRRHADGYARKEAFRWAYYMSRELIVWAAKFIFGLRSVR